MLAYWISGFLFLVSAFFLFGVPMIVLGPKAVLSRLATRPESKLVAGTFLTLVLAGVLLPLSIGPLISAGDIAQMSAENFYRLNWSV